MDCTATAAAGGAETESGSVEGNGAANFCFLECPILFAQWNRVVYRPRFIMDSRPAEGIRYSRRFRPEQRLQSRKRVTHACCQDKFPRQNVIEGGNADLRSKTDRFPMSTFAARDKWAGQFADLNDRAI